MQPQRTQRSAPFDSAGSTALTTGQGCEITEVENCATKGRKDHKEFFVLPCVLLWLFLYVNLHEQRPARQIVFQDAALPLVRPVRPFYAAAVTGKIRLHKDNLMFGQQAC